MPQKTPDNPPNSKQEKALATEPEPGFDRKTVPNPEADRAKTYSGDKEDPKNPAYQKKHPYSA